MLGSTYRRVAAGAGRVDGLLAGGPGPITLSVQVAGLRVARRAALVAVRRVLLQDQAELSEWLAVAGRVAAVPRGQRLVGAVALRQAVQEGGKPGLELVADDVHAERWERHQIAVELADPVDQPVVAGVGDQHIAPGAAKGQVLV